MPPKSSAVQSSERLLKSSQDGSDYLHESYIEAKLQDMCNDIQQFQQQPQKGSDFDQT